MRYRLVLKVLGLLVAIVSLSMIWPLYWSYTDGTADLKAFVISMAIGLAAAAVLFGLGRGDKYGELGLREAFAVVSLSWVFASLVGALPYCLAHSVPTFTDGFFEAMSGFTTTGASVLTDIESNPRGILFWRSLTHWLGGMGIIVLSLAILPFIGVGGMQLFKAEVPGPTPEKLTPRIQQTAVLLWGVYMLLTALETAVLCMGGMDLFQSLTHSFGTLATGGFSPLNGSVGQYRSPFFEWVITVFMFLAGANFTLHYMVLKGKWGSWWKDDEFRFYLWVVLFATVTIWLSLVFSGTAESLGEAFRDSAFQVVSVITTTGFMTKDFNLWPGYARMALFILMFIGGCAGSTGGGIKNVRIMVVLKRVGMEIKHLLHPQQVIRIRLNGKPLKEEVLTSVTAFFIVYLLLFFGFSLAATAAGLDFEEALSGVAATLGNIGPGLGSVGPAGNYSAVSFAGKWLFSVCMLLGRLEIFTVIMLFVPGTWRQ